MKKLIALALAAILLCSCAALAEEVTLRVFSNVPDRISGLGLLEETDMQAFLAEYENVKIDTEFLQDEPYKVKLQTYMQANNMPDLWMQWGLTANMRPIVEGNFALELNPDDYVDYGYVPGALDAFTRDGKLYGLPKNADFWVIYYNQALFEEFGVKVPETTDELIEAAKVFNDAGLIPCAFDGKDGWCTTVTIHNLAWRCNGDNDALIDSLLAGKTSESEAWIGGVKEFMRLVENNVFQPSFNSDDYGTAKNLFIQGIAAMYVQGSWEMGMGADDTIDPEVRDNVRAMKFPTINGYDAGSIDDLVMWYGGGYSVSRTTEHPEEAVAMLNYIVRPDVYAKNAWQMQITIPPMDYTEYLTGEENAVQLDLTSCIADARATSGECYQDRLSASFKTESQDLTIELASGMVDVETYLARLDELVLADE